MKKRELPSGYRWRVTSYADTEGIVLNVILVASKYKEGSWRDRMFGRDVLTYCAEFEPDTPDDEIDEEVQNLQQKVFGHYFR